MNDLAKVKLSHTQRAAFVYIRQQRDFFVASVLSFDGLLPGP